MTHTIPIRLRHEGPAPGAVTRVASVPTSHVYVDHLSPLTPTSAAAHVHRLPDPTDPWWPPMLLDPGWVRQNADRFDVMHVHFGFDAIPPATLADFVRALRRAGKPLVLTVHDLRNPHHQGRELHDAQLDVLIQAAAALITLTDGAAHEIARRWGRHARVVPHPHVVDLPTLRRRERYARTTRPDDSFRVGLHLKSMRACMSGVPVVEALSSIVTARSGVHLRIDVHTDVGDVSGERYDPALARSVRSAAQAGAEVCVHDFFSDAELWDYLAGLDLSVLPYRFGTHSGWLEACRDLGTTVVAPSCGYYADQGPVLAYVNQEQHFDADSLWRALESAGRHRGLGQVTVAERRAQRADIATFHAGLYRDLTARARMVGGEHGAP
jgi:glycosyltransferase involved in cell wall biosynthesis